MERVRQKMEEVIQKQKRLQAQNQIKTESTEARDRSQYILAFGGVAAGLTIAVIVWLAKSIVMTDHVSAADRAGAIHTVEIKMTSDHIARLNERVASLTESVSSLEAKLTYIMSLTDSIALAVTERTASSRQHMPESPDTVSIADMNKSDTSRVVQITTETEKAFIPSHTVKARVNLRPSASLHATPIAVLNVGTEVEYINKSDGWYFVNTRSHGKGWCSSEYLSPLLPRNRNPRLIDN
jgi:hypothetical protein